MSENGWSKYVTVQVKEGRHQALKRLQLELSASAGEMIDLRDVIDRVLEVGLGVYGYGTPQPQPEAVSS
jgi:hypothetical protein